MPRPADKKVKIGRNDPCPCGSGKKYKDCHLPIAEAHRTEQLRLRDAQETLLPKIIEAAQSVPEELPAALERFWQGRYAPEQLAELDELEDRGAERFLTWFAFDFRLADGATLVERLAAQPEAFVADEFEQRLLIAWTQVRLRPYVVAEVRKGKGIVARDLLSGLSYEMADYAAAKRMAAEEVMVAHLVPVDRPYGTEQTIFYLAGAAAQLTADTAPKLVEYCELHLADLRRTRPEADWDALINERSAVLNHFVTALPREEHDPTALERILLEGRVAMQLTSESIAQLLNRNQDATDDEEPG